MSSKKKPVKAKKPAKPTKPKPKAKVVAKSKPARPTKPSKPATVVTPKPKPDAITSVIFKSIEEYTISWDGYSDVVGAKIPAYYISKLPSDADGYPLLDIGAQSTKHTINIYVLNNPSAQFVDKNGNKTPGSPTVPFTVPIAVFIDGQLDNPYTLIFDGDSCTIKAVPQRVGIPEPGIGTMMPMDSNDGSPPPPYPA
ncbi:MAG TPA: hypothetical protein VKC60_00510 [Opitutaceae bacterium]|nr:hypothetical protein [Opitutaceae bacterium]